MSVLLTNLGYRVSDPTWPRLKLDLNINKTTEGRLAFTEISVLHAEHICAHVRQQKQHFPIRNNYFGKFEITPYEQ